ncbi:glycosyltransferase family 9 protein [Alphaproteobacteria bacterium]|nr:glycosyltransferase family 9 protein [Alphaproteobacteria bacterium]
MNRILIIKHGSLGDIIFALPVMYSIHMHYKDCTIDILTEKKYFNFLKKSNYFTNYIADDRSNKFNITIKNLYKLSFNKYDLIIDLQNSSRTSAYNFFFKIFSKAKISSSRKFSDYRYLIPPQGTETTTQGLFNQIKLINILQIKKISYEWLNTKLDLKHNNNIVLFIPGVSKKGIYKQWEPKNFAALAKYLENNNYLICVVGTSDDNSSIMHIKSNCKKVIDFTNKSPPEVIYSLAKISKLVITNDTGPGHIASLANTNILWVVNDNKITQANIPNTSNNYKLLSLNIKNISLNDSIKFIEKNNLL